MSLILTISGSLRTASTNSILLQAMAAAAPAGMEVQAFTGLGDLPHFNPDLDGEQSPESVQNFRQRLGAADGVIVSSPEYAHGIPGTLKNALDWLVSTMEIVDKPIVVINASTSAGEYSLAQLVEVLRTVKARVLEAHALQGIVVRRGISTDGAIHDPALLNIVESCFVALASAIVA